MAATDEFVRRVVAAVYALLQRASRFLPLFLRLAEAGSTIRFEDPARKFGSTDHFQIRGRLPAPAQH